MGRKVDRAIAAVQKKVGDKGRAIAILKSQGTIKQKGRHLVSGKSTSRPKY